MTRVAGLDVPRIVDAALSIADAEGVDRLTMRRLSVALDVTPMAIYHHVANKEQLLDLVVDESLRALPLPDPRGPCEGELTAYFLAFHRLLVRHPALAHAMAVRPLEGRVAAEAADRVLVLLQGAGLPERAAAERLVALFSYTLGCGLYQVSRSAGRDFRGVDSDQTPRVHRARPWLAAAAGGKSGFLTGLARLLDGCPG